MCTNTRSSHSSSAPLCYHLTRSSVDGEMKPLAGFVSVMLKLELELQLELGPRLELEPELGLGLEVAPSRLD